MNKNYIKDLYLAFLNDRTTKFVYEHFNNHVLWCMEMENKHYYNIEYEIRNTKCLLTCLNNRGF